MYASDSSVKQTLFLQSEEKNKKAQTWIVLSIVFGIIWELATVILAVTGTLAEYI